MLPPPDPRTLVLLGYHPSDPQTRTVLEHRHRFDDWQPQQVQR